MKRILIALIFLVSFGDASAQVMHLLPSTNLQHWYPFCSSTDLLDRTFSGFDLLSSGVTATTDRYGQPNRAYSFDGVASEMHYTTTFTIPAFGIADFTYSCHIYPTVVQDAIILYNGNPTANGLGVVMNNGVFGGGAGNVVSMLFGGIAQSVGFPVTLNQWHHILMRRNGNSYLLYVDGVMVDTYIPPVTPGYNPATTFFQLGCDFTALNKFYTGKIDDIAIYDRQVSNPEVLLIRDFSPSIRFTLGNDTAIAPINFTLGLTIDTTSLPNKMSNPTLGYSYQWSTGPADTQTLSTITFPTNATTTVTRSLTISRQYSCSMQDAINVTHIVPHINAGPDTVFCSGTTVVLNPGAVAAPGVSYLWNTGATTPSITVGITGTFWVRIDSTSSVGGVPTTFTGTDTVNTTASPYIEVNLGPNDTLCQGGTDTLSSSFPYVSPIYTWSDGITTTPTFVATVTGTYWLKVEDNRCVATDTIDVVIVYDTLTVFNPDTSICQGAFVIVRATASPDITYQWLPTSGIPVSNVPATTITPDTSATYILEGSIVHLGTLLNCRTRDTLRIDVQPVPRVDMGGNRTVCQFDSIKIIPTVTPSWYTLYSYDWSMGTYLDDSTSSYAVFTAGDTSKLVLTVTTPAGCTSADSMMVYTFNGNFASLRSDTSLCPGDSVKLAPISTEPGITTYAWHPATYLDDSMRETPVIRPASSIDYYGVATSQYGCKDTIFYHITMNPGAVIHLLDSTVIFPGESFQITPITNCQYHSWTPPIGLTDTAIINPVAQPPVTTNFILRGTTEDGCSTKDSIRIRVVTSSIINVPNAFVPGSYNGTLKVMLRGIARLRYFRIYNRWGNMVFEGKDITQGWDGKLNGVSQPGGVYIYEAEAVTSEGQILHKQGNVTLLE